MGVCLGVSEARAWRMDVNIVLLPHAPFPATPGREPRGVRSVPGAGFWRSRFTWHMGRGAAEYYY